MNFKTKLILIAIGCLLLLTNFVGCSVNQSCATEKHPVSKYDSTKISSVWIGLGSNLGSMQPVFKSVGTQYSYIYKQTSFLSPDHKPDEPICAGTLNISSLDSIIDLVKDIKDTSIWKNNSRVRSGGIQNIWIQHDSINLTFTL